MRPFYLLLIIVVLIFVYLSFSNVLKTNNTNIESLTPNANTNTPTVPGITTSTGGKTPAENANNSVSKFYAEKPGKELQDELAGTINSKLNTIQLLIDEINMVLPIDSKFIKVNPNKVSSIDFDNALSGNVYFNIVNTPTQDPITNKLIANWNIEAVLPKGPHGDQGLTGQQGPQGDQGIPGDQGSQGPRGI